MKIPMYKAQYIITLLLLFLSFSITAKVGDYEKTKKITESYTVTNNHKIMLNNRFGDIKIISTSNNIVQLSIEVEVSDNSEKKAQKLLDKIKIHVIEKDNQLSVETKIEGGDDNMNSKTDKTMGISIDYEVHVPTVNLLEIVNKFGAIKMDERIASTKINLDFGSLNANQLNGDKNDLTLKFVDPAVINYFENGKINLKFSKLELGETEHITLASEMSSSKIEKINKGDLHLKFGSIDLTTIEKLNLKTQMSSVKIDTIRKSGVIENKYGSLKVAFIPSTIQTLDIDSEFSPVKLKLEESGNYSLDAISKMGGLKLPKGSIREATEYKESDFKIKTSKGFKGRIGKSKKGASQIKIQSSFGEIHILYAN